MRNDRCIVRVLPGKIYRQQGEQFFPDEIDKVYCGAVVRVTSLKFGDVRLMQDVVIVRVRGQEFAAPVQRVRLSPFWVRS